MQELDYNMRGASRERPKKINMVAGLSDNEILALLLLGVVQHPLTRELVEKKVIV